MNSGQLVSYDVFKNFLSSTGGMSEGMPLHMLSSALAGTVATTISAPADVVRSRVMNMRAGSDQGLVSLIGESLKKEGPRFLFKGWLPAWSEFEAEDRSTVVIVRGRRLSQSVSRPTPSSCSSSSSSSETPSTLCARNRSSTRRDVSPKHLYHTLAIIRYPGPRIDNLEDIDGSSCTASISYLEV